MSTTESVVTALLDVGSSYEWYERAGIILGSAFGGVFLFPLMVSLLLCIVGFTCCGVRKGSTAACCQSSIGNVESGSCFACCQSAQGGSCTKVFIVIFGIGGAIIGGYIAFISTAAPELVQADSVTTQATQIFE